MTTPKLDEDAVISSLPFLRTDIEQTISARFERVVSQFGDNIALTGGALSSGGAPRYRQWTYEQLNARVNQIAHAIVAQTPPGGGCVAFLVEQSPQMVIATLAVVKAGKAYLGIHPAMPIAAQRDITHDAVPQLLLATADMAPRAKEISGGQCAVLILQEIDERYPDNNLELPVNPQDSSSIFYTSGTTGKPKGVVKSHRAVLHRVWLPRNMTISSRGTVNPF